MVKKPITLSLSLLAFSILTSNVNAATTSANSSKNLNNSYSIRNTIYVDVPYAESINSVKVNNGYVESYSFDKTTGLVKVIVNGGSTNTVYNSYKYSKSYSTTKTSDYSSLLPSSFSVSDGGYSGTVYRSSVIPTTSSKSVSASATHVLDYYWQCTSQGKLTDNPNYDSSKPDSGSNAKYSYSGGSWSGPHLNPVEGIGLSDNNWSVSSSTSGISSAYYSDSNGYSCTGSVTKTSSSQSATSSNPPYIPTAGNGWTLPSLGQKANAYYKYTYYALSGTATKTTYTGNYSGTLYKGGYDDVYSYTVTVSYNEDVLDINSYLSTNSWTNQDINITVSSGSAFFNKFVTTNSTSTSNPYVFSVSSNGTYNVIVYDSNHGRTVRNTTKNIVVSNIDKILPSGSFTPSTQVNWGNPINVTFNPTDAGGSGVRYWSYAVSNNNGASYGEYSQNLTGSQIIKLTQDGTNKIKIKITDNAGNTNIVYSDIYNIDTAPPENLVFTPNGSSWDNKGQSVSWKAEDRGSGIKDYRYRITTYNNNKTTVTDWSSYSSLVTKATITTEGLNYIEVEARDNLNNSTIITSSAFKIDYTAPTADLNIEDFIKDTFIDIPININNIKDNLSGAKKIEVSLYKDFSNKIEADLTGKTNCTLNLSRNGLSLEQTIYIKIYDFAGNVGSYQKNVYLDPLPPNTPNILKPNNNILVVNTEPLYIEWDYSDPGNFPLSHSVLIFTNKETNEKYEYNTGNNLLNLNFSQNLPQGGYYMTVKVYNIKGKSTESKPVFVRKNYFKTNGKVITKDIDIDGSLFSFIKIDMSCDNQKRNELIKTNATVDILIPDNNGNFNIQDTSKIYSYDLKNENYILKLPKPTNKIKIIITLTNTDKEYSTITSWLDNLKVFVK